MFRRLSDGPVLYRVDYTQYARPVDENDNPYGEGRIVINTHRFRVLRYTPCGAWIDNDGEEKFVNLRATKQYASASVAEAQEAFRQRKQSQLYILGSQIKTIERALRQLELDDEPCPF